MAPIRHMPTDAAAWNRMGDATMKPIRTLLSQPPRAGLLLSLVATLLCLGARPSSVRAETAAPLRVVVTVPDLGDLTRRIAGPDVEVTVITKGPEDAHFSQPKPSFVKALSTADAFVLVGMELEVGYAPVLLQGARNSRVLPGAAGYIDASQAVSALEIPNVPIDRSMGDVHSLGNPHYLLDPIQGLRVARLLRDRFTALRPQDAARFAANWQLFRAELGAALVGETLARKYDVEKLAQLADLGKLTEFLAAQGDAAALGGWLGSMLPYAGAKVVEDHRLWPYFARRFGLVVFGDMEPIPGVPPSTRHLQAIIERMRAEHVGVVITSPYYDPRHATFVAEATGGTVVRLTHQVGGLPNTEDYLRMVDYNVRMLVDALASRR